MRLASEDICFNISGDTVVLVPSLRAAIRLVRKYETFTVLAQGVLHGRLELMCDLVREGTGSRDTAEFFAFEVQRVGLAKALASVQVPMLEFVAELCAFDPDAKPSGQTGTPVAPEQFLESLFRTGTGWLGWSPEQTLDATPTEIIAAKQGRIELIGDMLKAVFGEAETAPDTYDADRLNDLAATGTDPSFDRATFHSLKARFGQ